MNYVGAREVIECELVGKAFTDMQMNQFHDCQKDDEGNFEGLADKRRSPCWEVLGDRRPLFCANGNPTYTIVEPWKRVTSYSDSLILDIVTDGAPESQRLGSGYLYEYNDRAVITGFQLKPDPSVMDKNIPNPDAMIDKIIDHFVLKEYTLQDGTTLIFDAGYKTQGIILEDTGTYQWTMDLPYVRRQHTTSGA